MPEGTAVATATRFRFARGPFESHVYRALPELVRANAIVRRLENAIALGMIRVGDRLPAEAELAESFGVAPATLREALGTLRDAGIVVTRRGRSGGTFVAAAPGAAREEIERRIAGATLAEIRDYGDEHRAIAGAAAELAAIRGERSDLLRLERFVARLRSAEEPAERARIDCRFHLEVAVVAQSLRLMRSEARIQTDIVELLWSPLAGGFDPQVSSDHAADLLAALLRGSVPEARVAAGARVQLNVERLVRAKLSLADAEEGGPRAAT